MDLMNIDVAAKHLGLHVMAIYRLVREGRIPVVRVRKRPRFNQVAVDRWMKDKDKPCVCGDKLFVHSAEGSRACLKRVKYRHGKYGSGLCECEVYVER